MEAETNPCLADHWERHRIGGTSLNKLHARPTFSLFPSWLMKTGQSFSWQTLPRAEVNISYGLFTPHLPPLPPSPLPQEEGRRVGSWSLSITWKEIRNKVNRNACALGLSSRTLEINQTTSSGCISAFFWSLSLAQHISSITFLPLGTYLIDAHHTNE